MSIRELHYGSSPEALITDSQNVDAQITQALKEPDEVVAQLDGHPVLKKFNHLPTIQDTISLGDSTFPVRIQELTADTLNTVRKTISILIKDEQGVATSTVIFDETYHGPQINEAHLTNEAGERGFIWEPTRKPNLLKRFIGALAA